MTAAYRNADSAEAREEFLRETLEISPTDLNYEFIKVPGEIAHWNEELARATYEHATAKLAYEREHARMFVLLRNRNEGDSKKPLPIDAIKAMCDNDEDLYELQLDIAIKDAERMRIRGVVEAVVRKADMLQSLGAKLREEARGELSLRSRGSERGDRLMTGEQ